MQHIDVFEMLEKQNCNVLMCSLEFKGSGTSEREVKTCGEIDRIVRPRMGEEASLRLEWRYPLSRVVIARCFLEDVETGETQVSLRDVSVRLHQFRVEYGYIHLDELKLSAAELRRPLAHVHQTSAPA